MAKKILKPKKFKHSIRRSQREQEIKNTKLVNASHSHKVKENTNIGEKNVERINSGVASSLTSVKVENKQKAGPHKQDKTQFKILNIPRNLFPKNKRFIPEAFSASFLVFLMAVLGIIGSFFIGNKLLVNIQTNKNNYLILQKELSQTQTEIAQYNDFKYLYLKGAVLAYEFKDYNLARNYLQNAINLDPNDEKILKLKPIINL